MTETVSVIKVSDLHINSTVALSLPVLNLDDGGTYHSSRSQRALWESWLDFWEQAGKLPGRRMGVFNGDLGELDTKRRSNQLITANKAVILRHVTEVIEPALDVLDIAVFIRGTQAHVGKGAWLEEAIANDTTITLKQGNTASWYQFRGETAGVRQDIAHHASMSGIPWQEKQAANKLAALTLWYYLIEMRAAQPHIVSRSHNHRWSDSGNNYADIMAFCLPCWSLITEFGHRTGRENSTPQIGGTWEICQDGKYQWDKRIYQPRQEARRLWALKI